MVGEPIRPVQLEGLRSMTPARKLAMLCDLYHAGIALRVAGIRLRHPDWPREKQEFEARRALRCAGTYPASTIHRSVGASGPAVLCNRLCRGQHLWRAEVDSRYRCRVVAAGARHRQSVR
jgi:hypothetical protein